ncbi:MAG: glycosyltransferase family 2 protein [Planctomycetota bacterium]|nr:glycosyltransferase family 2 protein [Planctomycetota bacterium]
MKVSILVPAYNEQSTIVPVLRKLLDVPFSNQFAVDKEILVVDDGSTDQTCQRVEEFLANNPADQDKIRLIRQPKNAGKTAAIAKAIHNATGDVMIIQDADLEYDPREIPGVLYPIFENWADVVYGSRFLVKKASRVLYFYHYVANKFLTLLSNVLTNRNMSDIETCYKAFRREVIVPLELTSKGFGMEVEITAMVCKTRARTYEVPISYYGRTYEEGKKIGMRDGIAAIWYILYYNLIHPWTQAGQNYIQTVDNSLKAVHAKEQLGELSSPGTRKS